MKPTKKIIFLIISLLTSLIQCNYTIQNSISYPKKMVEYSVLIASIIGLCSLTDQLINKRYPWKQTIFTGICLCSELIASFLYFNTLSMNLRDNTDLIFSDCYTIQKLGFKIYDIVNSQSEKTNITKIKAILDAGYDINFNLGAGFTALHYAILRKKARVCKFLISHGANPYIENCDNNTPLCLADGADLFSLGGNEKLIKILKLSKCTVFRPGLNRKNADDALKSYNSRYGLDLELGAIFLNK